MGGFAVSGAIAPTPQPQAFLEEPAPFWTAVKRGQTDAIRTRTDWSRREEVRSELWRRHREIEKRTGRNVALPQSLTGEPTDARDPVERFMDRLIPVDRLNAAILGRPGARTDDDYEAEIEALRKQFPAKLADIETRPQIMARIDRHLRDIRARADNSSGSPGGSAGVIVGEITGALMDPPNLGTALATGGWGAGRTLATRLLAQAGAGALTEGLSAPERMEQAQRYGGPEYSGREAMADIAFGAAAGAAFEGAVSGARAGWRAIRPSGDLSRAVDHAAGVVERDDLAIGRSHSGSDYDAALDSLDRGVAPPMIEPDRGLSDLFAAETPGMTQEVPSALPGRVVAQDPAEAVLGDPGVTAAAPAPQASATVEYQGRPIRAATFDPTALGTDPLRFQFKEGADAEGVTARLRGVDAWDPTAPGKVVVWEDDAGRQFVADGHQRRALARRLIDQGQEAPLEGYLFRSADGWSSDQVRVVAALKNIHEGSGSPLDAAKIFRDAPGALMDRSLPMTGDFIAQARGLSQLSDEAFGAVVNGVVPERYAAEIGALAPDRPDLHAPIAKLLKDGEPANREEARALVHEALLDDFIRREGDQIDLFGSAPLEATTIARAKVKAAVLRDLRADARIFGQLVKHADAVETGGNVLARDANAATLAMDRAALEVVSKLSLRGGDIGETMAGAARQVVDGLKPAEAARPVLSKIREALATGRDLETLRGEVLDPRAPTDMATSALDQFSEPGGRGAIDQITPKPEDAGLEAGVNAPPGLFDDIADEASLHKQARERLAACAPG